MGNKIPFDEFKNRHSEILSNDSSVESKQLLDLLNQGSLNIIDTAIELDFLRKHVNDSIDTIMESKELLTGVFDGLYKLQALDRDPAQTHSINDVINKLEQLKSEAEANNEQSNAFRPG